MTNHPLSPGGSTHVLLDANVLLPPRLSDVIFDLFLQGLFSARWSEDIEREFLRNWPRVVAQVKGALSYQALADERRKAQRRLRCYQGAVRDHEIFGHDKITVLNRVPALVDPGDRHVAAAALVLRDYADAGDRVLIVSSNVKHLAAADMKKQGIEVVRPGPFIDLLTQAAPERVGTALEQSVTSLSNPPYTRRRLLEALRVHQALSTAQYFEAVWRSSLD